MNKEELYLELLKTLPKNSDSHKLLLQSIIAEYGSFTNYLLAYGPFKDIDV